MEVSSFIGYSAQQWLYRKILRNMKIVLHIGSHKTATTYLQETLRANQAALAQQRVVFMDKRDEHIIKTSKAFCNAVRSISQVSQREHVKILLDLFTPYLQAQADTVVYSEENFIGRMLNIREPLYPHTDRIASALQALAEKHVVKVIAYTRRQDSFIESCFLFRKMWGGPQTVGDFAQFVGKLDMDGLSWTRLLQPFISRLGRENCFIRPYEAIYVGADFYARDFVGCFADAEKFQITSSPKNSGLSAKALEIISCIDSSAIALTPQARRTLGGGLRMLINKIYPDKPVLFNDAQRHDMLKRYEQDNQALFRRFMPGVDPMLYSVEKLNSSIPPSAINGQTPNESVDQPSNDSIHYSDNPTTEH